MIISIADALVSLRPGATFTVRGNTYSGIQGGWAGLTAALGQGWAKTLAAALNLRTPDGA